MSQADSPRGRQLSHEDFDVLNREILALSRAGVPLGSGLRSISSDSSGRIRKLLDHIGQRIESGQPFSVIVASRDLGFPAYYAAAVETGMRTGNLSGVLESVATTHRRLAEVTRIRRLALVYPLCILLLAYVMFLLMIGVFLPPMLSAFAPGEMPFGNLVERLAGWGTTAPFWAPLLPILIGLLLLGPLLFGKMARQFGFDYQGRFTGWPYTSRMSRLGQSATFCEVLALLVEHEISLAEAIVLAAKATGRRKLITEANRLSLQLREQGMARYDRHSRMRYLPAVLRYALMQPVNREQLAKSLRNAACRCRTEADSLVERLRWQIPLVFTVVIGGTATAVYALLVLGPWYGTLIRLSVN